MGRFGQSFERQWPGCKCHDRTASQYKNSPSCMPLWFKWVRDKVVECKAKDVPENKKFDEVNIFEKNVGNDILIFM
jgi:hypothetical protein